MPILVPGYVIQGTNSAVAAGVVMAIIGLGALFAPVIGGFADKYLAYRIGGSDCAGTRLRCGGVDADTGIGTCVEMCTGTPDDPACPVSGQTCRQLFSGVLNVCLPDCNPLLPGACAPGLACVPEVADDGVAGFVCLDDYGGPLSGEACSWHGSCGAGHTCIDAASFGPGCESNDCCTEFCDLTDAAFTCAGPDQQCVALFDPADPLYANVGACMVP